MTIRRIELEALRVHMINFGLPIPDQNHQAKWLRMLANWLEQRPDDDPSYIWQIRFYPGDDGGDVDAEVTACEPT